MLEQIPVAIVREAVNTLDSQSFKPMGNGESPVNLNACLGLWEEAGVPGASA